MAFPGRSHAQVPSGWEQQTSGVTGDIYSVSAVSKTTAWAAAGYDGVLKTTDGGATWKKQTLPDEGIGVLCVCAVNSQVAWAGGNNLYRTINGGATWRKVLEGFYSAHYGYAPISVSAADSSNAWVGIMYFYYYDYPPMYSMDIVKTSDGGATWSEPQTSFRPAAMPKMGLHAVDRSTAWAAAAADSNFALITKTEPGEGWKTQFSPSSSFSYLVDIDAVDTNNAWAVGESFAPMAGAVGVILHSADGGTGWHCQDSHLYSSTQASNPILAGVSAVDAQTAWAVGNGGAILKTTDGENWAPQTSGVTAGLWSVSAVDAQTAWAVGTGGVILHTTDGGGASLACPDLQSVSLDEEETEITLQGSGFGTEPGSLEVLMRRVEWDYGYPVVKQGWSLTDFSSWSDTEICCVLPAGLDAGFYEVMLKDGKLTSSRRCFTLGQFTGASSITPYYGADYEAVDVTIKGHGFDAPNLSVQVSNATTSLPVSDVVVVSPEELTCTLDLNGKPLGKYDVSVSSDYTSYSYKNGFTVVTPKVSGIAPRSAVNLGSVPVSIYGLGFQDGATVRLVKGSSTINAANVSVKSECLITCSFNLFGKPTGKYDVVVHNPDGHDLTLTAGFTVTNACGQSAALSVSLFAGMLGLLSVAGLGWRRKRLKA